MMMEFSKNRNNLYQSEDIIGEQIRDEHLIYHQNTQATRQETEYDHDGDKVENNVDYEELNREWKSKTE